MKKKKNHQSVALVVQSAPSRNLINTLAGLETEEFVGVLVEVVKQKRDPQLKALLEAMVIQNTETAFRRGNEGNVSILTRVAREYPFKRWLKDMGISASSSNRSHLQQWWSEFMKMAWEYGYKTDTTDAPVGAVYWKATRLLAEKIQENPLVYQGLQALTVNQPQHVGLVLNRIPDAIPFIEVLIGERFEELRTCPPLLLAFIVTGTRTITNALWNVGLMLQPQRG